jgi:hypothetical protein
MDVDKHDVFKGIKRMMTYYKAHHADLSHGFGEQ